MMCKVNTCPFAKIFLHHLLPLQVHVIGPQNVLHKYEPFLLNTPISMLLYLLSSIIVTASSSVIYMYGYQKFMAFISQEREKQARNGEMRLGIFDGLDKLYDL